MTATYGKTKLALGTVTSKGAKTVKLDLTKAGKKALFTANRAKVKLTASVNDAADNRTGATATRTLR
jgi:hypothetical protein